MRLTIIGTGYVGLVTGACLADVGHVVTCVDIDAHKVSRLNEGQVDIYEPGLSSLIQSSRQNNHLFFTTDTEQALRNCEAIFIAVGTPARADGSTDLDGVLGAANAIGNYLANKALVIIKSTVPVGTGASVLELINSLLAQRHAGFCVEVVSNPEFLKEGAAVNDFTRPDRIIVGCHSQASLDVLHEIYAPYNRRRDKILAMDVASAELTKYTANAMLAARISLMNEVASIAESVGADIEAVRQGIGSDPRIGFDFIYSGCGYGGSCFPKDVKALANTARRAGQQALLLSAIHQVNEEQKTLLFRRLEKHFGHLSGKTIALWGLAFKPNTDDIRDAPSRTLMERLWQVGARVQAYDPIAIRKIQQVYGNRPDLVLCANKEDALRGADALAICTEWKEFMVPDYDRMRSLLKQPVIMDGRNLYEPARMKERGFTYYGVGRGESCFRK